MEIISPSNLSALAAATALLLGFCYTVTRHLYPRPLPGIPYNKEASKRILGDLWDLARYAQQRKGFRTWFLEQAHRHNSAVTQVFLGPLSKAAIIVSDYREANNILRHRDVVDFKRGLKVEAFRGILPHAFPAMETFDPSFRGSRQLAKGLMTPFMLHTVNAPRIYDVACDLVDLWGMKSCLAAGRPFDVANNISEFSFDAIMGAAMGLGPEGGDIKRQHEYLINHSSGCNSRTPAMVDDANPPFDFPAASRSAKLTALHTEENSLWKGFVVPWPGLYYRLNKLRPKTRAAGRTIRGYIASQIAQAVPGLTDGSQDPQCALDFVIQRELRAAAKEGRTPALVDPRILDLIYGYLIAGHDTTSGALRWLVRRMVAHPEEQDRVRRSLQATYHAAWRERRLPSATELVTSRSPYLDAFIEETLRCDTPIANVMVMTRHDTVVLGNRVPANTRVFLNLAGPSLNRLSVPVSEAVRHDAPRLHKPTAVRENWDGAAPEEFRPDRWLKVSGQSTPVFDAAAGPMLAFSAGNRGCWGKRLAYLQLRIVLALLIWSFEITASDKFENWETSDTFVTAPQCCIIKVKKILYT